MAIRNANLGGIDWVDDGSTTLDGGIDDSVTTITSVATSSFKSGGGCIQIDNEKITYTGVTATDFTGCTRGAYTTTAASHLTAAAIAEKEVVTEADLNDTFDAMVNYALTLTAFWLNSNLYTVYDDFTTEVSASLWTANVGSLNWSNTNNAGNTAGELKLNVNDDVESDTAISDSHIHFNWAMQHVAPSNNSNCVLHIGNDTDGWDFNTITSGQSNFQLGHIFVVAKGSDLYDVYNGGKLIETDLSKPNGLQFRFVVSASNDQACQFYVDEVRYSSGTVA